MLTGIQEFIYKILIFMFYFRVKLEYFLYKKDTSYLSLSLS